MNQINRKEGIIKTIKMKPTQKDLVREAELAVVTVLSDILVEKGLITKEELDERVKEQTLKFLESDFKLK